MVLNAPKTKRYRLVDGGLIFWKHDRLQYDPEGTRAAAEAAVDRSGVQGAVVELERLTLPLEGSDERYLAPGVTMSEYHKALVTYRDARNRFDRAVAEYGAEHPVFFEPRYLEEIVK